MVEQKTLLRDVVNESEPPNCRLIGFKQRGWIFLQVKRRPIFDPS